VILDCHQLPAIAIPYINQRGAGRSAGAAPVRPCQPFIAESANGPCWLRLASSYHQSSSSTVPVAFVVRKSPLSDEAAAAAEFAAAMLQSTY
jgi:hypothetical protein